MSTVTKRIRNNMSTVSYLRAARKFDWITRRPRKEARAAVRSGLLTPSFIEWIGGQRG